MADKADPAGCISSKEEDIKLKKLLHVSAVLPTQNKTGTHEYQENSSWREKIEILSKIQNTEIYRFKKKN